MRIVFWLRALPAQRNVAQRLMRSLGVVMFDELRDQVIEMFLTKHDEVIQHFLLQALDESLDVRLQIRRSNAVLLHLDPGVSDDLVKSWTVDSIAIAQKERDLLVARFPRERRTPWPAPSSTTRSV